MYTQAKKPMYVDILTDMHTYNRVFKQVYSYL